MKILITEDEFYNRIALVKMIQDEMDEQDEILEASNGIEALDIINNTEIDILCTDIRMPEMDGLELIEEVYRLNKDMGIIVISGYAEFEYAQKALRFGVEDYLLKPVNKTKVKEILRDVKRKIKFNNQKAAEVVTIIDNLEKARKKVILQKLVSLLLHGDLNELDEINSFFSLPRTLNNYCIISVAFEDGANSIIPEFVDENKMGDEAHYKIFNVPLNHINGYQEFIVFDYFSEEHMTLITLPNIIKQITGFYKNTMTSMGISGVQQEISQMSNSYKESLSASFSRYFNFDKRIFFANEEKRGLDIEIQEQIKGLKYCIYLQNSKQVFKSLESFFYIVKEKRSVELLLGLDDMIMNLSRDKKFDRNLIDKKVLDDIPVFHSIYSGIYKDLESYFLNVTNYIVSVCYRNNENNAASSINAVNAAKIYVEDNYQESISQDSMTKDILFINTSYFSRIFKEHEGVTFSKYLKALRLKKAKELLIKYDYPLAQIAGMVGFNDTSYFVSSFRNQYGMTPNEYRTKEGN